MFPKELVVSILVQVLPSRVQNTLDWQLYIEKKDRKATDYFVMPI